ncbi:helix-hairpin-helix domain-containing protein [Furfurilactobacillus curtus]|uniref:Competence protein ComE n=1 Tax=Furfurilactobacillus curtus TaxID=1746200 RepID=A0ABQ5JM25_9LACO
MDWIGAVREARQEHRKWLLSGLSVLLIASIIGTLVVTRMMSNSGHRESGSLSMSRTAATSSVLETATSSPMTTGGSSKVSTNASKLMTVEVKGAVNHPGVYQLSRKLHVVNAINRAGGLRNDAESRELNQALQLRDQMVIYVPGKGEQVPAELKLPAIGQTNADHVADSDVESGQERSEQASEGSGGTIPLNNATKQQLTSLTGVGDKKAQKIIDYRTAHGGFKTLDELKQVPGFGDKTLQNLKPHLRLS